MDLGTLLTLLFLIFIIGIVFKIYINKFKWFLDKESEINNLIKSNFDLKYGPILNIYKPNSNEKNPFSRKENKSEIYFVEIIEAKYYRVILTRKGNQKFESWSKIETGIFMKPKIKFSNLVERK